MYYLCLLRTIEEQRGSNRQNIKDTEPRPKFPGSYKKNSVYLNNLNSPSFMDIKRINANNAHSPFFKQVISTYFSLISNVCLFLDFLTVVWITYFKS